MSVKKIYQCNTCGENYDIRIDAQDKLRGLNYLSMKKFKLGSIDSTEGYHICIYCIAQIYQQAKQSIGDRLLLDEQEEK